MIEQLSLIIRAGAIPFMRTMPRSSDRQEDMGDRQAIRIVGTCLSLTSNATAKHEPIET